MNILRFGIPSVDRLLGTGQKSPADPPIAKFGLDLTARCLPTSLCLSGPEGTGKSVLGLHLASRYRADVGDPSVKIIYVSTDLSGDKAQQVWENFDLGHPHERVSPFVRWDDLLGVKEWVKSQREKAIYSRYLPATYCYRQHSAGSAGAPKLNLTAHTLVSDSMAANGSVPLVDYLRSRLSSDAFKVAFLDLARESLGDAWGVLNRLLHAIPRNSKGPSHLLIVDAVEGLESLVGERDAFGERSTRRARINQIMRLAAGKCHIFFVVEESDEQVHLPEDYITDVVIRLRSRRVGQYNRRTIEVVKCRGQSHTRGEHPFTIRKGNGSTTGYQQNADDPIILRSTGEKQGYVLVFPSLHYLSRETMERGPNEMSRPSGLQSSPFNAGFGIRYLDNMLASPPEKDRTDYGLPGHRVTALIGDPSTHKSHLGYAFIGQEFARVLGAIEMLNSVSLNSILRRLTAGGTEDPSVLALRLPAIVDWCRDSSDETLQKLAKTLEQTGGGVLITTKDVDVDQLADRLTDWIMPHDFNWIGLGDSEARGQKRFSVEKKRKLLRLLIVSRIVCRRLEVHDLPTPVLFHVIAETISGARRIIVGNGKRCCGDTSRLRVVLDDFSTWKEIYPDVKNEPLFLPALLFHLRRGKVTALIVDTHPGRPDIPISDPLDSEFRALVDHQLYTWRHNCPAINRTESVGWQS